ncbi:pro-sigmaK processing inhibitor BofA family protein [Pullulanibacillus sp. KACC 23026]|uniref:pro-sigmaK processing inhibitor BofA family protein n=1 Tax=Pullulanibacillus sp. KACC 23026 TaxID=3028315 RepID=UPI0023B06026|nr:pro-sigmaK processing inhibitor BofA family protein [Pullulanibacillus sp. KACC 23026]WEG12756.1 pro-sigmaK processing inhibitor BofA family protein [Pullulanibacillus sp. KACC 23026]
MQQPIVLISIAVGIIVLFLLFGTALKPFRFIGSLVVKLLIGGLLLFFLNILGTSIGLHIPINAITTVITGILGLPGLAALVVIKLFMV